MLLRLSAEAAQEDMPRRYVLMVGGEMNSVWGQEHRALCEKVVEFRLSGL